MTLTKLAQETDIDTGVTTFFLVFDPGGVRIPVSQEAMQEAVRQIYGGRNGAPVSASDDLDLPEVEDEVVDVGGDDQI